MTASGMRGIMLLDVLGKVYHALIRIADSYPGPMPIACQHNLVVFKGSRGGLPSLFLRSYTNYVAAKKKVSMATICVDVRSAFHCLLRQCASGTTEDFSPMLQQVLSDKGMDLDALRQTVLFEMFETHTKALGITVMFHDRTMLAQGPLWLIWLTISS
eukprot:s421_g14.t1